MIPNISYLHFLLVDESPHELSILDDALRSIGAAAIHTTTDVADALKILKKNEMDIVFINTSKQTDNGIELVSKIRSTKGLPNRGVNIVMTSAACDVSCNEDRAHEGRRPAGAGPSV